MAGPVHRFPEFDPSKAILDIQKIKAFFLLLRSVLLFLLAFIVKNISRQSISDERSFLIGSNYGGDRDDNAIALYQYICSQQYCVFYIDNSEIETNAIKRGSFKSFLQFFRSEAVFFTHSFSDILPYLHKAHWILKYFNLPQRIFIQHGVIGLKSQVSANISMADYLASISDSFDKMIVSSRLEFDIVSAMGVPDRKLAITGLPRFDLLSRTDTGPNVLVFLTWSTEGPYLHKLNEILDSDAVKLLQASGLKIIVRQHTMMQARLARKETGITGTESLQSAIKASSLLITDDSSVAWDFFYKGSDVIFYKPDPGWLISDDKSLNIRIARSDKRLKELTQEFLDSGFEAVPQACDFNDHHNAARVFALANSSSS